MFYKIFKSSIKYSDNRYYKYKKIDIVKISKRLFNKNTAKNTIYFIIEFKNIKLCGFIAKKNKITNIITFKELSLNDKNIKKILYLRGGENILDRGKLDDATIADINLTYINTYPPHIKDDIIVFSEYHQENISSIGKGTEGTVYRQPFPFLKKNLTFDLDFLKKINPSGNVKITEICNSYLDYSDIDESFKEDVSKISNNNISIESMLLNNIIQDIKIKFLYDKFGYKYDDYFAITLKKISFIHNDMKKFYKDIIIPSPHECKDNLQFIYNYCGEYISLDLLESINSDKFVQIFIKFLKNIKNLNDFGIIHLDIRYDNILLKDDSIKLIDFGIACDADNIYNKILSLYLKDGLKLYPFDFAILFLINTLFSKISNLQGLTIKKIISIIDINYQHLKKDIIQLIIDVPCSIYKYLGLFSKEFGCDIIMDFVKMETDDDMKVEKVSFRPHEFLNEEAYLSTVVYTIFDNYYEQIKSIITLNIESHDGIIDKQLIQNIKNIVIFELFGEDYYKKVDIFYIGLLMVKFNSSFGQVLFPKEITENCFVMNNFKNRFTVDKLIAKLEKIYPSVSGGPSVSGDPSVSGGVLFTKSRSLSRVIKSFRGKDIFKKGNESITFRESKDISYIKLKKTYNCDAFKKFDINTIYNINKIGICNEDNYRYNLEDFHKFIQFIENKERMGE